MHLIQMQRSSAVLSRKSRHSRESGNPPDAGPRLRGDDDVCNFQVNGWPASPWPLRMKSAGLCIETLDITFRSAAFGLADFKCASGGSMELWDDVQRRRAEKQVRATH